MYFYISFYYYIISKFICFKSFCTILYQLLKYNCSSNRKFPFTIFSLLHFIFS